MSVFHDTPQNGKMFHNPNKYEKSLLFGLTYYLHYYRWYQSQVGYQSPAIWPPPSFPTTHPLPLGPKIHSGPSDCTAPLSPQWKLPKHMTKIPKPGQLWECSFCSFQHLWGNDTADILLYYEHYTLGFKTKRILKSIDSDCSDGINKKAAVITPL